MAKIVFFYLMKPLPYRIREAVPLHVEYWKGLHLAGYSGGPFADRSGGMIMFELASVDAAMPLVDADPFATSGLLEWRWVKEWLPE
ncbi:MAG TPA: YciI family protein [Thermoanaerobaculia bacterium]